MQIFYTCDRVAGGGWAGDHVEVQRHFRRVDYEVEGGWGGRLGGGSLGRRRLIKQEVEV